MQQDDINTWLSCIVKQIPHAENTRDGMIQDRVGNIRPVRVGSAHAIFQTAADRRVRHHGLARRRVPEDLSALGLARAALAGDDGALGPALGRQDSGFLNECGVAKAVYIEVCEHVVYRAVDGRAAVFNVVSVRG